MRCVATTACPPSASIAVTGSGFGSLHGVYAPPLPSRGVAPLRPSTAKPAVLTPAATAAPAKPRLRPLSAGVQRPPTEAPPPAATTPRPARRPPRHPPAPDPAADPELSGDAAPDDAFGGGGGRDRLGVFFDRRHELLRALIRVMQRAERWETAAEVQVAQVPAVAFAAAVHERDELLCGDFVGVRFEDRAAPTLARRCRRGDTSRIAVRA